MKAGLLNGQVKENLGQTRPAPSGEKPVTIAAADINQMTRLLHLPSKWEGHSMSSLDGWNIFWSEGRTGRRHAVSKPSSRKRNDL